MDGNNVNEENDKKIDIIPAEDLMPSSFKKSSDNVQEEKEIEKPSLSKEESVISYLSEENESKKEIIANNPIPVKNETPTNNPPMNNTQINSPPIYSNIKAPSQNNSITKNLVFIIVGLLIIGGGLYFILFGGKKQLLICKQEKEYMKTQITFEYKNQYVELITSQMEYDLSIIQSEELQEMKETILNNIDLCKSSDSTPSDLLNIKSCKQTKNGDKILATLELTITDEQYKKQSISELREMIAKEGMTCNIE